MCAAILTLFSLPTDRGPSDMTRTPTVFRPSFGRVDMAGSALLSTSLRGRAAVCEDVGSRAMHHCAKKVALQRAVARRVVVQRVGALGGESAGQHGDGAEALERLVEKVARLVLEVLRREEPHGYLHLRARRPCRARRGEFEW